MDQEVADREMEDVQRDLVRELSGAHHALYRAYVNSAGYLDQRSALYQEIDQARKLVINALERITRQESIMPIKTVEDYKAAIKPGTVLEVVDHWSNAEIGSRRIVTRIEGNTIWWRREGTGPPEYPSVLDGAVIESVDSGGVIRFASENSPENRWGLRIVEQAQTAKPTPDTEATDEVVLLLIQVARTALRRASIRWAKAHPDAKSVSLEIDQLRRELGTTATRIEGL